jgi:hypothetical protein
VQYLELFAQQTIGQETHAGNVLAGSIEAVDNAGLIVGYPFQKRNSYLSLERRRRV